MTITESNMKRIEDLRGDISGALGEFEAAVRAEGNPPRMMNDLPDDVLNGKPVLVWVQFYGWQTAYVHGNIGGPEWGYDPPREGDNSFTPLAWCYAPPKPQWVRE